MNQETRRAMLNAVKLISRLKSGEKISREDLIDALSKPLPDVDEDDATLRHAYRHYVLRRGIDNAEAVITYEEAARLSSSTVDALRSAAYRDQLVKLGTMNVESDGRKRCGITLRSLAEFKHWPLKKFQEASRQVAKWREAE